VTDDDHAESAAEFHRHYRAGGSARGGWLIGSLFIGVIVIAITVMVGAVLGSAGAGLAAVIAAVLCGLPMLFTARAGLLVAMAGVVIAVACGVGASQPEAPLFGEEVRGITVSEAPNFPNAAYFRFSNGEVIPYRGGRVEVRGSAGTGRSTLLHILEIAPLVGTDWNPGRPVTAWVITSPNDRGRSRADWARPYRAAVRVNSINEPAIRGAIQEAGFRHRMTSVENAPVLRWVADPDAAKAAEWARIWWIIGIGSLVWLVTLLASGLLLSTSPKPAKPS